MPDESHEDHRALTFNESVAAGYGWVLLFGAVVAFTIVALAGLVKL